MEKEYNEEHRVPVEHTFKCDKDVQFVVGRHSQLEFVSIACEFDLVTDSGFQALVSLENLQCLELTGSDITGEGIEHIATNASLKTLNLRYSSKLTNEGISNVLVIFGESLEILDLSWSTVVTVIEAPLPKLKELKLSWVNLTGLEQLLSRLADNLTVLDLSGTRVTGEEFTTPLPKLKSLNLSNCDDLFSLNSKVFGDALRSLSLVETELPFSSKVSLVKNQTLLEDLDIDIWRVTGDHDGHLSNMLKTSGARLKVLRVNSDYLTGECFTSLKDNISNLQELAFHTVSLNEPSFNNLMRTVGPSVKKLTLEGLGCTGSQLNLSDITFSHIEYLALEWCDQFTDSVVSTIIGHCGPNLKNLKVTDSPFSGDLLSQYSVSFPLLERIEVTGGDDIDQALTTTGLCAMFRTAGTKLKNLKIHHANFTGRGLSEFSAALSDLESIEFGWCSFNDEGFLELFSHGKSDVRSLELLYTDLSGVRLGESSVRFPQIRCLDLSNAPHLNKEGFRAILAMCGPSLKCVKAKPHLISYKTRGSLKTRGITVFLGLNLR